MAKSYMPTELWCTPSWNNADSLHDETIIFTSREAAEREAKKLSEDGYRHVVVLLADMISAHANSVAANAMDEG